MEMVLLMFYGWKGNQDPEKNLRNGEDWIGDSGSVPRLKWWRQGLCLVQCSSGWIVIMEPKSWALLWPVLGFPCGTGGKEPACQCRRHKRCGFYPWVRKIPWKRAWQPTSVFLPGECHGQRSLVGYSPRGHKMSNMIEQLTLSNFDVLQVCQMLCIT